MHCNPQRNYTHNIEFHLPFLVIIVIHIIVKCVKRTKSTDEKRNIENTFLLC